MDFSEYAENLGIDTDDFMELTELFIDTSYYDLDKLLAAIDQEDFQAAVKAAHSIKGAAGNLGFNGIYEKVKTIEMDAREGRLGKNGLEVSVIRDMLDELGKSINEPDKMV
ncbi:MAG: Hpt domain-containing protein [Deltaproteobacteria bacterium]|nr:Hpt domain-containing protein [Deltaproteobacteria bacterium]